MTPVPLVSDTKVVSRFTQSEIRPVIRNSVSTEMLIKDTRSLLKLVRFLLLLILWSYFTLERQSRFLVPPVISQTVKIQDKVKRSQTSPEGIRVFSLTREPAATMAFFSTTTPSSSVAPMPTNASSSTVHPCITAL